MYRLDDYDYELPESLIAHTPQKNRDTSRLLFLNKKTGTILHNQFFDIANYLRAGDVLVLNNTKVVPGRLLGEKETGGRVELLILNYAEAVNKRKENGNYLVKGLIKAAKRPKPDALLFFGPFVKARVLGFEEGVYSVELITDKDLDHILETMGNVPLPPYIQRNEEKNFTDDKRSYQTVYAREKGAIAAPTAGLHFTESLLDTLSAKGIIIIPLTLHVGYGTFVPVRVDDIREHKMHEESFSLDSRAVEIINSAKASGGRVIAVGTTSVRTLEYQTNESGFLTTGQGKCDLFIYPGYRFKMVDGMITNFHLPQSTLLMLVAAFAGLSSIKKAYEVAISGKYRFFSYGDAMFISE